MAIAVPPTLKDASLEQLQAILEIMYYVAKSDGVFSHEEITHFLNVAHHISGGRISAGELGVLVGAWSQRDPSFRFDQRLVELRAVLPTPLDRETACNLAAQLAEADDALLVPEQKMLDLLGMTFFPSE